MRPENKRMQEFLAQRGYPGIRVKRIRTGTLGNCWRLAVTWLAQLFGASCYSFGPISWEDEMDKPPDRPVLMDRTDPLVVFREHIEPHLQAIEDRLKRLHGLTGSIRLHVDLDETNWDKLDYPHSGGLSHLKPGAYYWLIRKDGDYDPVPVQATDVNELEDNVDCRAVDDGVAVLYGPIPLPM